MMRAILCREHGPIETLRLEEVSLPPLSPGTVRIEVEATGVAFANVLSVEGRHQNRPPLPYSPGNEVAGRVSAVGEGVERLAVGDRVAAACEWGGFAEAVTVPEVTVYRIPDSLDFRAATAFPVLYGTALQALQGRAGIGPGATVLVHAAAGGTGSAAVEVARWLGARVIATARGPEKVAEAMAHGADHAIDTNAEDMRDAVLAATDGRGVDLVYDPVGGDVLLQSLRAAAPEAMLFTIGYAGGTIPEIPANLLLVKNLRVSGLYYGYYLGWGKSKAPPAERQAVRERMERMLAAVGEAGFSPRIDGRFPLAHAVAALDRVRTGKVVGKLVLEPGRT